MAGTTYYFQRHREVQPEILKKLDIFSFTRDVIRSRDVSRFAELPWPARAAAAEIGYLAMTDEFERPNVEHRFMELFRAMGGRI